HGTSTASAARSSPNRSCSRSCVAVCGATTRIVSCSGTRSRATICSDACATIPRSRESFRRQSSRVSLTCATPCGISTSCSRGRWRTAMDRGELLYEGKAKQVYRTSDPALLIQHFKDDATAFNAQKRGTIVEKGIVNNRISEVLFGVLEQHGIATHFVRRLADRDMLVRACKMVKIEVVVRNIIAGSLATRLGRPEGEVLAEPVLEHYLKDDALGDPLINDWHIRLLRLATAEELAEINATALRVNDILRAYLDARDLVLVDFKLEFGRHAGRLLVADEIGPDTCRLWDKSTQRKLDKDRFRRDLGDVEEAYQEAARRICGIAADGRPGRGAHGACHGDAQARHPRSAGKSGAAITARARIPGGRRGACGQVRRAAFARRRSRRGGGARAGHVRAAAGQRRHRGLSRRDRRGRTVGVRWGVVTFPGSNDDRDMLRVADRVLGDDA